MASMVDEQVLGGAVLTPEGAIPLSPEEAKAILEAQQAAEEQRLAQLRSLVADLEKKRDAAVRAKAPIEKRWVDDLRQYNAKPRMLNSKQYATDNTAHDSTTLEPPRLHVTRARCDLWEARLSDMIFPANDQSWDLELPRDYAPMTLDPTTGQLVPDEAACTKAGESCQAMKEEINAQLQDCKFVRSGRRMVRDACQIGTGLLMGPMNGLKTKRTFGQGMDGTVVDITETPRPEIREGDPWCFYPEMVPHVEKAGYAFYLHLSSERDVQELAQFPGFDKAQIAELLRKDPELGVVAENLAYRNQNLSTQETLTDRYGVWRYTGSITRDQLKALQLEECACDDSDEDMLALTPYMDIWFCQGCILKAKTLPIDKDYRIPYFVFAPFPADDSMFGLSLPYMCRDSDRMTQAALQMLLLNASVSSGPVVISRAGKVQPKDGKYDIRGPKWLEVTDPDLDLKNAISIESITNNSDQAEAILQMAIRFIDLELNAEQWASPDPNTDTTDTASGLAMLMNAKSILQRRAAACADDEIFVPVIERMIWWNMLYNPRDDIRGDYTVAAKAQTVQLVKDIQAQHLQVFMTAAKDPYFAGMSKPYGVFESFTAMLDVPKDKLIVSEDEYQQNQQNMPPDPMQALNDAKTQLAQAQAQLAAANAQLAQAKVQHGDDSNAMAASGRALDHAEFQQKQETEITVAQYRVEADRLKLQAALARVAAETGMTREQIAAQLQQHQITTQTELAKTGIDARMQAEEMALKRQMGSGV